MENLTSVEFLDRLQEKEIKNIYMQYSDVSGNEIKNVVIKDSKFFFVVFRRCSFKNVTFENCEFFFCAFGYIDSENLVFKKCKMDYTGFTEAKLKDGKFIDTSLAWHSFVDTAPGFELKNCTEFRVFRTTDDLTPSLAGKAWEDLQPMLNTFDFDMRQRVMQLIESVRSRLLPNVNLSVSEKSGTYETGKKSYSMFDSLIDNAVASYGTKPAYKTGKNTYEAKSEYKK